MTHLAAAVLLVSSVFFSSLAMTHAAEPPLIVAHRGASHDAPENTLAAFLLAWEQGADGIEGDFHLTSDGRVICLHDDDFKRVAGDPRKVAEMTFDEARSLDVGGWKSPQFKGQRAPSLVEVMATVPAGKHAFIELKAGPEIVGPMLRELDRTAVSLDQIVVISFKQATILECKRRVPRLHCHWLTSFKRKDGQWNPTPEEIAATASECRADGVGLQANREAFDASAWKATGLKEFHVWTVDAPEVARFYSGLGARGITTNRPDWLREQLK